MRRLTTCESCGVEFFGEIGEKLCPMCARERRLAMQRGYRKYYKERGWCYDCGKPVLEGRARCADCLAKHRNAYKKMA